MLEETIYLSFSLKEWWCCWRKWWDAGRKATQKVGVKVLEQITLLLRVSYGHKKLPAVDWNSAQGCQGPHWVKLVLKYLFQKMNAFSLSSSLLRNLSYTSWPTDLFWVSLPQLFSTFQGVNWPRRGLHGLLFASKIFFWTISF